MRHCLATAQLNALRCIQHGDGQSGDSANETVGDRSSHTVQSIQQCAVVMLFVPKIQDGQNDQRRHKASHLAFPSASALQQQHRPAGRLRFFCRECSLFAGGTVDHLIGSRVRGMSPGSALLSWRDLRSTPDRRSPVSCFSFSDRVSVPDRRSFEARLSSPDRFSSLPIVVSVGLPRIMLDRARLSHETAREAWQSSLLFALRCIQPGD